MRQLALVHIRQTALRTIKSGRAGLEERQELAILKAPLVEQSLKFTHSRVQEPARSQNWPRPDTQVEEVEEEQVKERLAFRSLRAAMLFWRNT